MPGTPSFRNADRVAKGRLLEIIRSGLADGRSAEQISRLLYAEHGIEVSGPTLRRWLADFDEAATA
jgi:hypothetical protein